MARGGSLTGACGRVRRRMEPRFGAPASSRRPGSPDGLGFSRFDSRRKLWTFEVSDLKRGVLD